MADKNLDRAYDGIATLRRWERERKSPRWQMAQAAATRRLLLNGDCVIFKSPDMQNIGKRKLVKGGGT